jgi:hypothetical protein
MSSREDPPNHKLQQTAAAMLFFSESTVSQRGRRC